MISATPSCSHSAPGNTSRSRKSMASQKLMRPDSSNPRRNGPTRPTDQSGCSRTRPYKACNSPCHSTRRTRMWDTRSVENYRLGRRHQKGTGFALPCSSPSRNSNPDCSFHSAPTDRSQRSTSPACMVQASSCPRWRRMTSRGKRWARGWPQGSMLAADTTLESTSLSPLGSYTRRYRCQSEHSDPASGRMTPQCTAQML